MCCGRERGGPLDNMVRESLANCVTFDLRLCGLRETAF